MKRSRRNHSPKFKARIEVNIPRQSRGLYFVSRSKRLDGSLARTLILAARVLPGRPCALGCTARDPSQSPLRHCRVA